MELNDKQIEEIAEKVAEKVTEKQKPNFAIRYTFLFFTFLFTGLSVLFYFLSFYPSDLFMQLCIGAATGCFVVTLQETARDEEYRIKQREKNDDKNTDNKGE